MTPEELEKWTLEQWTVDIWQESHDEYYLKLGFNKAIELAIAFAEAKGFILESSSGAKAQLEIVEFLKSKSENK